MNTQSIAQALTVLEDTSQDYRTREQAVHELSGHPTPQTAEWLVQALEDEEFGVRWAAAVALIQMGELALTPLLRALTQRPNSIWLREGAHHILYYTGDTRFRQKTAGLLEALKGPAAQLSTAQTAYAILQSLAKAEGKP
jgi:HEAT repeat protein